tara:strand:+ start:222 stop:488 length:267 start_codon:yes stop_codon:yes gene_type:complete
MGVFKTCDQRTNETLVYSISQEELNDLELTWKEFQSALVDMDHNKNSEIAEKISSNEFNFNIENKVLDENESNVIKDRMSILYCFENE